MAPPKQQQQQQSSARLTTYKATALKSIPEPIRAPASSDKSHTDQQKQHQSGQSRLLSFLQRQKELQRQTISDNHPKHTNHNGNGNANRKKDKSNGQPANRPPNDIVKTDDKLSPRVVPLKRRIHQHNYQNLAEDVPVNRLILIKTLSSSSSSLSSSKIIQNDSINCHQRNKLSNLLSSNVSHSPPQQQYRHFGDTNHLRNNRKLAQKRMQQQEQQEQPTQHRPEQQQKHPSHEQQRHNVESRARPRLNASQRPDIKELYSTCNINGIDAIATPSKSALTQFVDVKNRIRMFANEKIDYNHNQAKSADKRMHYKNHQNDSDYINCNYRQNQKLENDRKQLVERLTDGRGGGGGGSSNISSSNSNSSDINSLDSMEHESNYRGHTKNVFIKNGVINKKNMINVDQMPHLGPFNFRQLLRPTQGPTNSLRKRKSFTPK